MELGGQGGERSGAKRGGGQVLWGAGKLVPGGIFQGPAGGPPGTTRGNPTPLGLLFPKRGGDRGKKLGCGGGHLIIQKTGPAPRHCQKGGGSGEFRGVQGGKKLAFERGGYFFGRGAGPITFPGLGTKGGGRAKYRKKIIFFSFFSLPLRFLVGFVWRGEGIVLWRGGIWARGGGGPFGANKNPGKQVIRGAGPRAQKKKFFFSSKGVRFWNNGEFSTPPPLGGGGAWPLFEFGIEGNHFSISRLLWEGAQGAGPGWYGGFSSLGAGKNFFFTLGGTIFGGQKNRGLGPTFPRDGGQNPRIRKPPHRRNSKAWRGGGRWVLRGRTFFGTPTKKKRGPPLGQVLWD